MSSTLVSLPAALAALARIETALTTATEGLGESEAVSLIAEVKRALRPSLHSKIVRVESDHILPGTEAELASELREALLPMFGLVTPYFQLRSKALHVQPQLDTPVFDDKGVPLDQKVREYGLTCYIAGQVSSPLVADCDQTEWQVVPVKAQEAMMEGAFDNIPARKAHTPFGVTQHLWDYMLARAPRPPADVLVTIPPILSGGSEDSPYVLSGAQLQELLTRLEDGLNQSEETVKTVEPVLKVLRGVQTLRKQGEQS